MAEKYLRDALLKVEAVCKGGGEEMVRSKCKLVSTIILQVSPCMADKWESLLSNLGHTYRKLRRLNSFFLFIYVLILEDVFLGMMKLYRFTCKHWF